MRTRADRRLLSALMAAVLAGVLFAGGCSKTIVITRYPAFFNDSMKDMAVAVVPFRNETNVSGAGNIVGDMLTRALMNNSTYCAVSFESLGISVSV